MSRSRPTRLGANPTMVERNPDPLIAACIVPPFEPNGSGSQTVPSTANDLHAVRVGWAAARVRTSSFRYMFAMCRLAVAREMNSALAISLIALTFREQPQRIELPGGQQGSCRSSSGGVRQMLGSFVGEWQIDDRLARHCVALAVGRSNAAGPRETIVALRSGTNSSASDREFGCQSHR